jgi:hypothetical protein
MTWDSLIRKLRKRGLNINKIGNAWYLKFKQRKGYTDWKGNLGGVLFEVYLDETQGYCLLTSKQQLPELREALKIALNFPAHISGGNSGSSLIYAVLMAKTPEDINRIYDAKIQKGFTPNK